MLFSMAGVAQIDHSDLAGESEPRAFLLATGFEG